MNRRNKYTFAALSLPYSLICSSLFNLYFAQFIIAKKFKIDFTKCNCKFYFIVCHEFCLQKVKKTVTASPSFTFQLVRPNWSNQLNKVFTVFRWH